MKHRLPTIALVLIAVLGTTGRAQEVVGLVREEARQTPVAGAVVILTAPSGSRVTATLTDDAGRFRLRAPSAGTYGLRVDVIGYRSAVVPAFTVEAGSTVTRDVPFRFERTQLPAVAVTAASACARVSGDAGDAPRLWAEARKTLEATRLAIEEQRFNVALRRFERTIGLPDSILRDTRTWTQTGVTQNPFETLPPETVARSGFSVRRDTSRYYYAPDANVLLSDAFVEAHCFGTRRGGPSGAIGLTFRPQQTTATRVDVSGVLWLDSASAELRSLEYRYVMSNGPRDAGGGFVGFGRYPSGVWGVQRWAIRLPVLHVTQDTRRPDGALGRFVDTVMVAVHETGGEITTNASASGGTLTATRLRGVIFDSTQGRPMRDAVVTIEGLGRTASTDSAGQFAFDSLADEGEFRVRVWHPRLDSLGFSAPTSRVRLRRRVESSANFTIPGISEVSRLRCSSGGVPSRVVMGVVRSGADSAPPSPNTEVVLLERRGVNSAGREELVRHTEFTSDAGRYAFCGMQPRAQGWLLIRVGTEWTDPIHVRGDSMQAVEIVPLRLPVSADVEAIDSTQVTGAPLLILGRTIDPVLPSRISGWVLLPENHAGAVQVLIDDLVRGTVAPDGRFLVDSVGAGTRRLTFRSTSLAIRHVALKVEAGQSHLLLVTLRATPVVVVQRNSSAFDSRMTEFRRRRQAGGGGVFIERRDIERRNPRNLTDLLRGIPGVRVLPQGAGFRYVSAHFRRLPSAGGDDGTCDMLMYVDGLAFPIESGDADARININEIGAVEVYVSAGSVPRQFAGATAACGVIVIWRGR